MLVLNLLNRIFGNKGDLSRSEIDSYVKEKRELHKIEEKSLSDDFNADALEGFDKHGLGTDAMKSLDERMNLNASSSKVLYIALFSAAAVIVLLVGFYSIQQLQNRGESQQLARLDKDLDEKEDLKTEILSEETKNNEYDELNNEERIEENFIKANNNEEHASKKNNRGESNDLIDKEYSEPTQSRRMEAPVADAMEDDFEIISRENLRSNNTIQPSQINESSLNYQAAKEVYFHDFKLIDYREYRSGDKMQNKHELPGVPADQKDKDIHDEVLFADDISSETNVTYISYIEETMRLMKLDKLDKAIPRFKKILSVYPDDINANFYLGIAYFEKENYNESIVYLEQSFSIFFGNFYEEAQFYIAKAHIGEGRKSSAKKILRKIVLNDGFYANQAQELLKGL